MASSFGLSLPPYPPARLRPDDRRSFGADSVTSSQIQKVIYLFTVVSFFFVISFGLSLLSIFVLLLAVMSNHDIGNLCGGHRLADEEDNDALVFFVGFIPHHPNLSGEVRHARSVSQILST
jgi:hypothetical protein